MKNPLPKFRETYQDFAGLLSGSFLMTLARAVAMTYIVLALHQNTPLPMETIGVIVGGSTFVGGVLSFVVGGMLDLISRRLALCGLGIISAGVFTVVPLVNTPWLITILLVILAISSSLFQIAIKSTIAENSTPELGQQVFSLRYSLTNFAFGAGSLLGAALMALDRKATFWAAGGLALIASLTFRSSWTIIKYRGAITSKNGIFAPLRQALQDARLLQYSFASFIASIAVREFPSYITMFLIAVKYPNVTGVISIIVVVNNAMIVTLQMTVTKAFSRFALKARMSIGLFLLSLGLLGFMLSHSLIAWGVAMAIFTLGEMIILPAEFALVDAIAPSDRRSSYFAMQNLATLGGSFSPILCGFILAELPAQAMFIVLVACSLLAMAIYSSGHKNSAV